MWLWLLYQHGPYDRAGQLGLVVPYGDEDALEQALSRLACDPDLRRRLGECARQAYESTYSWAVMAARLRKLYADLLSGPDRSEQA